MAVALLVGLSAAVPAWGQCPPQEVAKLTASDAISDTMFGVSIAISGDAAGSDDTSNLNDVVTPPVVVGACGLSSTALLAFALIGLLRSRRACCS